MKSILARLMMFAAIISAMSLHASAGEIEEAASAYSKGDYAGAVALYGKVAESKGLSSSLCYDMGNAYARGGDYGHALVCYIRALRLDPSNSQASSNISYIESKVMETNRAELKGKKLSVEPDSLTFFASVRRFICRDNSSDTWAVWAAAAFILFVMSLATYIFTSKVIARKIGFFGGFIFLGISLITLVFAFMAASYRTDEGVVTGAKVKLLSEASVNSKESPVALTRGTRMTVLDTFPSGSESPDWYKVRLNSDFVGWIPSSDFEPVGM